MVFKLLRRSYPAARTISANRSSYWTTGSRGLRFTDSCHALDRSWCMRNRWHRWDIKNWEAEPARQSWNSTWWAESNLVWQFQFRLNPTLACEYFIDVPVSPFPHFPLGGFLAAWALHSLLIYGAGLGAARVEFRKTEIGWPAIWLIGVSLDVVSIIEIHGCESIIIIFQIKPFFNLANTVRSQIPKTFFITIRLLLIFCSSRKPLIQLKWAKIRT